MTDQDRRQVEQEARLLEWSLCEEEQPFADECRISKIEVSATSDGRAMVRITLVYRSWEYESSQQRIDRTTRYFERFGDGWSLSE